MQATLADPLVAFVERLRALRQRAEEANWTIPEPPPVPPPNRVNRLDWKPSERQSRPAPITLEELRTQLPETMKAYITDFEANHILLVKVAAGGGKTHAGVHVAQWAARQGLRVLWAAGRHDMFRDLALIPGFDPRLWYHWLPIHERRGENDPIPTTCRYASAQHTWTGRGYEVFDLCFRLCSYDRHMRECPYRLQARRREPIVFAMHQHLASGLAINDFDLVIVDELPLKAFKSERIIPPSGLDVGATGPLRELTDLLAQIAGEITRGQACHGRELFERIGPILSDVYAQIEVIPNALPMVPRVYSPDEVNAVPYWYVLDLLRLASPEYDAWRHGWPRWAERIKVTARGLHLLDRAEPWEQLPRKIIVLDATAQVGVYRQIFNRPIESYHPRIRRVGRLFQVTARLNGSGSLTDDENEPTKYARELLEWAKQIANDYQGRVGIVCHKALRPMFEREFGESNVVHFYGARGTNSLQDVVCLIVAGTPGPDPQEAVDCATAFNPERTKSFLAEDEDGNIKPIFTRLWREYEVTDEARAKHGKPANYVPVRVVGGYWTEPDLQAIYEQFREAEIVQAIHRARINVREADVWLFSPVPISEPLDDIYDYPPIGPEKIPWKVWLKIKPWLDEMREQGREIGYEELAAAAGMNQQYVRDQKWLDVIREEYPEEWETTSIAPVGRGRPRKALRPV